MKQLLSIILLFICSCTYSQNTYNVPNGTTLVLMKTDSGGLTKFRRALFNEGFDIHSDAGMIFTDYKLVNSAKKYAYQAELIGTDSGYILVIKCKLDASLQASAYQQALIGATTNTSTTYVAESKCNGAGKKVFEYLFFILGNINPSDIFFNGSGNMCMMVPGKK